MVLNVFTGLKQYQDVGGDLVSRIKSMGLHEVFEPLIDEYGSEPEIFNQVLFFILNVYSRVSPFVVLEAEWSHVKEQAAIDAGMDITEELYHEVCDLKKANVTRTIRKYLDYQKAKPNKHLLMLKDLYEQMVNAALEVTPVDGKVDYDQKKKNADYASKLYTEIAQWEQRIETLELPIKRAVDEFKEVEKIQQQPKNSLSLRMEDHLEDGKHF